MVVIVVLPPDRCGSKLSWTGVARASEVEIVLTEPRIIGLSVFAVVLAGLLFSLLRTV